MAARKKTRTPKKSRKKAPAKKKRAAGIKASAKKRKPAPKKKAPAVKKKPARKKAPAQKARPTGKPAAPAAVTERTSGQTKTVEPRNIKLAASPALEETARRKFRVENPIRKPSASRALSQNTLWDELIFVIVSDAGPRGITIENICKKALSIKHSKAEIMEKNIAPESNFHNSTISNIEAVSRYLDDNLYRTIYGYRDITKK